MYYIVKSVTVKNGRVFATVADSTLTPRRYVRTEYRPKTDLRATVTQFLADVAAGEYQPLPDAEIDGKSLYKTAALMGELLNEVPEINAMADRHCDLCMTERLYNLVAGMATVWLFTDDLRITEDDLIKLHGFAAAATALYEAKRQSLRKKGVMFITAAARTRVFPGHIIMIDDRGELYLGSGERYDNAGRYDNGDFSAVCLARADRAEALFGFLAFGSREEGGKKPEIDFGRLAFLPEIKEYERLYAAM